MSLGSEFALRLGKVSVPARPGHKGQLIVDLRHAHRVGGLMSVYQNGERLRLAQIVALDEEAGEMHYAY